MRELELKILHVLTCDIESPFTDTVADYACEWRVAAVLFALLLLALLWSPARRPRVARMGVALLIAAAAAGTAKAALWTALPRQRPGNLFDDKTQTLIGSVQRATCAQHPEMWVERSYEPRSPSFPSSHTIFAAVVAGTVGFAFPWLAFPAWLYAAIVGMARLYWGKHWPSDVLGSLLLGLLISWAAWRWAPRLQVLVGQRVSRRGAVPPTAPG